MLLLALCHGALRSLLLPREGCAQGGLAAAGRRDEPDAFLYVPCSEGVCGLRHLLWQQRPPAILSGRLSVWRAWRDSSAREGRSALRGD